MSWALKATVLQPVSAMSTSALALTVTSPARAETSVAWEVVRGALKFFSLDSSIVPIRARARPGRTDRVVTGAPPQSMRLSFASDDAVSIRMGSLTWARPARVWAVVAFR
ncbi:hypothetical protein D3C75_1159110 [compost metagenome]